MSDDTRSSAEDPSQYGGDVGGTGDFGPGYEGGYSQSNEGAPSEGYSPGPSDTSVDFGPGYEGGYSQSNEGAPSEGYSPGPSDGSEDFGPGYEWVEDVGSHAVGHGAAEAAAHGLGLAGPVGLIAGAATGLEDDSGGHSKDVDPDTGLPYNDPNTGLPYQIDPNTGLYVDSPEPITHTFEYNPLPKDINISSEDGTTTIPEDDTYYTWDTPINDDGTRGEPSEGAWVDPIE